MPVPIHPGCSNKINNEGFLGEGLKGREGGEIEGVGSYSSRCRFTVSTMRSPQVTLRSVPLSVHARRHNKSFRGTARPETDFVRSVRPLSSAATIAGDVDERVRLRDWIAWTLNSSFG